MTVTVEMHGCTAITHDRHGAGQPDQPGCVQVPGPALCKVSPCCSAFNQLMLTDQYLCYAGHKLMADMAVHLVQRTAFDLLAARPWGAADELELASGLPEPMYPGNYGQASRLCVHNEALQPFVRSAQGWQFRDEGKDVRKAKYGYVATEVGSRLVLEVGSGSLDAAWMLPFSMLAMLTAQALSRRVAVQRGALQRSAGWALLGCFCA